MSGTMRSVHAIYILSLFASFLPALADRKFTIINNCATTIWPAILTGGTTPGPSQGWEAQPKTSVALTVPDVWQGQAWARQQCTTTNGKFSCATGDCGRLNCTSGGEPSVTLLEWGFTQIGDFYDMSIVNAFNLPVEMKSNTACPTISCPANFTASCPKELQGAVGSDGTVLSCLSSCKAGIGNTTQKQNNCGAGNDAIEYYNWFHSGCPKAYASPSDDQNGAQSGLGCPGVTNADYTVTFCPEDVVNIAAPTGPFANATTSTGSSDTITAASSATGTGPVQTSGTTSSGSSSTPSSSTADSSTTSDPNALVTHKSTLSGGAIAGIVIGALLGLGALLLAFWWSLRRKRNERSTRAVEENVKPYGAEDASAATAQMIQEANHSKTFVSAAESAPMLTGKRALMMGGSRSQEPPGGTSSGPSAASDSVSSPTDGAHRTGSGTQTDAIFEERFQARLQEFLHQHMDPPPVDGRSEAGLPAYSG